MSLLTFSASRLARMIRTGEVSSREVVDAHIAHVERVNDSLNALVADRFSLARREADVADARIARRRGSRLPPFHGVPCSIKESFCLEGMPNTSGLVARRRTITPEGQDATAVARLRKAGAIPLGVTNVPELCMWVETDNCVYGRTSNPYDPDRIAGGSSGGEGALIGAGGTPFGLGADVGGSIRMPAFFNGVFGHKPTGGMVPATGQFPIAHGAALRYLTTGPLARRAEDLFPLLRILAGPDGIDTATRAITLRDPGRVRMADLVVIDVEDDGKNRVSVDLRNAQARVADHLRRRGARVERISLAGLDRAFDIWSAMMGAAGGPTFSSLLGNGRPIRALPELLRFALRTSPYTLPALILVLLEDLTALAPRRSRRHLALGPALRTALMDAIGPRGVMLYPSFPRVAPRHGEAILRPFEAAYTAVFNVMEMPVTQVPLGLDGGGLPLGIQVAAVPGNDHLTLAVALELEKAFGGWVPPPAYFHDSPRIAAARKRPRSSRQAPGKAAKATRTHATTRGRT